MFPPVAMMPAFLFDKNLTKSESIEKSYKSFTWRLAFLSDRRVIRSNLIGFNNIFLNLVTLMKINLEKNCIAAF